MLVSLRNFKLTRTGTLGRPGEHGFSAKLATGGALFRSIVENGSEIVSIVEPDGTLLYASPAIERVMDYDPEEMVGQNVLEYVHPDDLPLVVEAMQKALTEPGMARNVASYRFLHKDGSWRHVESTGTSLLEHPEVGGIVVVTREVTRQVTRREQAEKRLSEAEARYRLMVEGVPVITYAFAQDPAGHSVPRYVSPQVEGILGYTPQEYAADPALWRGIVHPDDREQVLGEDLRTGETGETFREEFRMISRDGRVVWFREEGRLAGAEEDGTQIWHGVMYDITERKRVEAALKESEGRYRALVENAPAIVYIQRSRPGRAVGYDVTYMSPKVEKILGYPARTFEEDPAFWNEVIHPDDLEAVIAEDYRTDLAGEPFSLDYRMIRKDGSAVWLRDDAFLIRDEAGTPLYWQGVMTDITERRTLERELERRATHDSLTGLPNRVMLAERLGQALSRTKRGDSEFAVLFVDLDDFKVVNDSSGHEVGDRVLVEVAGRLKAAVRPEDTVARHGGDEFVVLLENTDRKRTLLVTERIAATLENPFNIGGTLISVTASIGVAPGDSGAKGPEDLLRNADQAMYRAKEEGKACHMILDRNGVFAEDSG